MMNKPKASPPLGDVVVEGASDNQGGRGKFPAPDQTVAFAGFREALYRYLRARLPDHALAEDIVQDVLLKALKAELATQPIRDMRAWLYRVARTTMIDYLRRQKRQAALSDALELQQEEAPPPNGAEDPLTPCVLPLVQQLPEAMRDTLLAAEFYGEPLAQIADREGVSLSAIKSRASRGRALLRDYLLSCCEGGNSSAPQCGERCAC